MTSALFCYGSNFRRSTRMWLKGCTNITCNWRRGSSGWRWQRRLWLRWPRALPDSWPTIPQTAVWHWLLAKLCNLHFPPAVVLAGCCSPFHQFALNRDFFLTPTLITDYLYSLYPDMFMIFNAVYIHIISQSSISSSSSSSAHFIFFWSAGGGVVSSLRLLLCSVQGSWHLTTPFTVSRLVSVQN